jgi:hypothetical protein
MAELALHMRFFQSGRGRKTRPQRVPAKKRDAILLPQISAKPRLQGLLLDEPRDMLVVEPIAAQAVLLVADAAEDRPMGDAANPAGRGTGCRSSPERLRQEAPPFAVAGGRAGAGTLPNCHQRGIVKTRTSVIRRMSAQCCVSVLGGR